MPNLPPVIVKEPKSASNTVSREEKIELKRTPSVIKFDKSFKHPPQESNPQNTPETAKEIRLESKTELTLENLDLIWKEIATSQKEKRPGLANLMDVYLPSIKGSDIEILVESQLQYQLFEDQLDFLRANLKHRIQNEFSISIKVAHSGEIKKPKLYTPQDKFKRLVEINKNIALLQKELGLDFDYNS